MLASTKAYIAQHLPPTSAKARAILSEPVVVRIRNFDVAMEMAAAFDKFQVYIKRREKNLPTNDGWY
ncbi:MAG: hypothetical protein V3T17_18965 [Pseudomonadales bacterium]